MFFSNFFSSKKGQGLSLNVIIIAAIALIVLVIVITMVVGKSSIFNKASADCQNKGGECESLTEKNGCPDGGVKMFGAKCEQGKVCCTNIE